MKINFNNKKIYLILLTLLVLSSFFIGGYANAIDLGISNAVSGVVGHIVQFLVWILGGILFVLIYILIWIAQYNDFIKSAAVTNGWVIVRDLCNMFFVLIILIIAFATILKYENYHLKKLLPKLLIMAVLINFSKMICGLIIDFSQVIMLTFVNGFKDMGSANLTSMLGIKDILAIDADAADVNPLSVVGSYLLALLYTIISVIVVLVIVAVLAMRIVMLWIYIVLSPLAYLLSAFPAGAKYASQWWSEFSKQVVVGPVLAFFIWLSFISIGTNNADTIMGDTPKPGDTGNTTQISQNAPNAGLAKAGTPDNMIKFIISIGMLIGGLIVTQQVGGMAGAAAGRGINAIRRMPRLAGGGALGIAGWGARKVKSGAVSELFAKKEVDEQGRTTWKGRIPLGGAIAKTLHGLELRPTKIIEGVREGLKEKTRKEEIQGTVASAEALRKGGGLGLIKGLGASKDLTESLTHGFFWHRGFKRAYNVVKGSQEKRDEIIKEIEQNKKSLKPTQKEKNLELLHIDEDLEEAKKRGDKDTVKQLLDERKRVKDEEVMDEDVKKATTEKIKASEAKLRDYRPIQTFYADREREGLVMEQRNKIGDNDNEEQLITMFDDAMARKDKEMAAAVMLVASKVGHLNEIIQSQKATEDVKDETGKVVIKKGHDLDAGGYGLHALVNQRLIKELGMGEQEAYSHQSQASSLAKAIGHFNLAESIGAKNGMLFQRKVRGPNGMSARARVELRKVDAEKALRQFNRLAWMDEIQEEDPKTGRVVRKNKLSDLGKANFAEWADQVSKEIDLKRINKNTSMNIYKSAFDDDGSMNDGGIYGLVEELRAQGMTKFYDHNEKTWHTYEEVADKWVEYGKMIAEGEESAIKSAEISMRRPSDIKDKGDKSFKRKALARAEKKMKEDVETKEAKGGKGKKAEAKKPSSREGEEFEN